MCSTKLSRSNAAETWRPVAGFEGYYEVSDRGRVRSVDHYDRIGRFWHGKILSPHAQRSGYLNVHLSKNDIRKTVRVHRLVAEALIDNPSGFPEVNHLNEDVTDNRAANLEWCTRAANLNYGTYQTRKAVSQGKPVNAILDGVVIATFASQGIAARFVNGRQSGIALALSGKCEHYRGLRWEYA